MLAQEAGGQNRFEIEAATLGEVLQALPIADLIIDEHGALRPLVNVYVDGIDARDRDGLATELGAAETVRVIAAVAGGQRSGAGRSVRLP
jgi:molybdopterin converting factor small subunit